MENKRKIWVRVAAFMAAIICCVICVIPAYAEEGEYMTAEEQETYLNQLIEPLGVQFDLAANWENLDYNQILYYGFMRTDDPFYKTIITNSAYSNRDLYIDGHLIVNISGPTNYSWGFDYNRLYIEYNNSGVFFTWNSDDDGQYLRIYYYADTGLSYRIRSKIDGVEYSLYKTSGYTSYDIQSYSFGVEDVTGYAPFGVVVQPRQLLELNIPSDNEEIYNQGYQHGYEIGFFDGETYGYDGGLVAGREEGYIEGEADGYRTGYDDGMHQTSLIEGIKDLFRAPMEFVESALNFEIFGIDLGDAVKAIVSMMLLALVVTIVWKAVK